MRVISKDLDVDVNYEDVSIVVDEGLIKDELRDDFGYVKIFKQLLYKIRGHNTRDYTVEAVSGHHVFPLGVYDTHELAVKVRSEITEAFIDDKDIFYLK
ncbi:hypothetical protein RI065_04285 [Mycoplasmatota bacterium zrk1]